MKEKILEFIHGLSNYDYILFAALFFIFLLLLILTLLLRKRAFFASVFLILSLTTLFVGPFIGYIQLHDYLYKNSSKITEIKALEFSPALVVMGNITNESERDFSTCKVNVNIFKVAHNEFLDTILPYNPFQTMQVTETNITKGETRDLKIIVEPFSYKQDYNVSLGVNCR
jgi:hypothetical protein